MATQKNVPTFVVPATTAIPLENLIPIEELAKRLDQTESWVREKCRHRCSNPIPVYNLGRHLLFDWVLISEWIRNTPRPIHVRHTCRKRTSDTFLKQVASIDGPART
jgi:hypothetical protein